MSRLLPVSLRSVVRPLSRLGAQLGEAGPLRLVTLAREHGLAPIALFAGPAGATVPSDAPSLVLVHEPAKPEQRAGLYPAAHAALGRVLLLSSREWEVWSEGVLGRLLDPNKPLWGAPLPVRDEDDDEARRRALRQVSSLLWTDLPDALHRDAPPGAAIRAASGIRAVCTTLTLPSRFPAIPPARADGDALYAATFGVVHATFAGEVAPDDGPALDVPIGGGPSARAPHDAALDRLTRTLRADLPAHLRAELRALYLLPGPWGTLHAAQIVAVVPDDAPLHRAAALRRRLGSHVAMLPRDLAAGALLGTGEPVVVSVGALRGQLLRRLWRRPLRRLAIRLGARRILGEDALYDGLRGADVAGADLRGELAALTTATAAAFCGGRADEARDLLFGAWPRTLALLSRRPATEPLASVHADLAGRTDRALSRVGSAAPGQPWGDPVALDRGRAAPLLREWGPALIRLQEFALEVLE